MLTSTTLFLFIFRSLVTLFILKPVLEWYLKRRKFINIVNKIPGYRAYPLIGCTWLGWKANRDDIIDIAIARPKLFRGGISRAWLGPYAEIRVDSGK